MPWSDKLVATRSAKGQQFPATKTLTVGSSGPLPLGEASGAQLGHVRATVSSRRPAVGEPGGDELLAGLPGLLELG